MDKLRIGVIGLGFIGKLHARVWAENPQAQLVAVADIYEPAAKAVGDEYGCAVYTDYNEMLKRDDLDAVDICVPEDFHVAPAVAAAEAKKNFIIEKPIAKTVKEANEIKDAAEKNGVRMMVAHLLKFDPRYVQLNDAIEDGKIGTVTSLALKRTNSKGTPKRLKGKVSYFYYMGIHDIEWMLTYVTFDNGSIGSVELNWAFPENGACGFMTYAEVVGSKGAAVLHVDDQGLAVYSGADVEYPDALHWPIYNGKLLGDLKEELAHFADATLNGKPYLVDTGNAIAAVAIAEAAMESIKTGQVVTL